MKIQLKTVKLNLLILLILSSFYGCYVKHNSSKETIIKETIKEVSNNNKCEIDVEFKNSNKLNLLVTQKIKQENDYSNGLLILEIFEDLKNKGISNCTIKIANKERKNSYIELTPKGYVAISNLKKRSNKYVRLLLNDNEKFYDLLSTQSKKSFKYSDFLKFIDGNLEKKYEEFGGFVYSNINSLDCFFFEWKEMKSNVVIGLIETDSLIYGIEFLKK